MIFECEDVTRLVMSWQLDHDKETMAEILKGCQGLIEAIVSAYDPEDRDDLIQESYFKIQYAIPHFNPRISNLHNYLTTVIRNLCNTWASKADREVLLDDRPEPTDDDQEVEIVDNQDNFSEQGIDEILSELIARNRMRFPSIPATVLDVLTEYIYYSLRDSGSAARTIITELSETFSVDKSLITMVFQSSLVYIRYKNISCAKLDGDAANEFSLIEDLKAVIGDEAYQKLMIAFAGMSLRIPS